MTARARRSLLAWPLVVACSSGSGSASAPRDAGGGDAASRDAGGGDSGPGCDGPCPAPLVGRMRLLELTGRVATSSGGAPTTVLDARASFQPTAPHDFDGRSGGLGCVADHYVAGTKPAPADEDAGTLRWAGFAGGPMLDGSPAAQPIVGVRQAGGYYAGIFPAGQSAAMAPFPQGASPLGPGPISFATGAGAGFGAALATSSAPPGTLTLSEDLTAATYAAGSDATFHVACAGGCGSARVTIRILATSSKDVTAGWPYARVGRVDCDLAAASSPLAVPAAALAAMLASDGALDTFTTSVALLPAAAVAAHDSAGNLLEVDAGRGVFGVTPRP